MGKSRVNRRKSDSKTVDLPARKKTDEFNKKKTDEFDKKNIDEYDKKNKDEYDKRKEVPKKSNVYSRFCRIALRSRWKYVILIPWAIGCLYFFIINPYYYKKKIINNIENKNIINNINIENIENIDIEHNKNHQYLMDETLSERAELRQMAFTGNPVKRMNVNNVRFFNEEFNQILIPGINDTLIIDKYISTNIYDIQDCSFHDTLIHDIIYNYIYLVCYIPNTKSERLLGLNLYNYKINGYIELPFKHQWPLSWTRKTILLEYDIINEYILILGCLDDAHHCKHELFALPSIDLRHEGEHIIDIIDDDENINNINNNINNNIKNNIKNDIKNDINNDNNENKNIIKKGHMRSLSRWYGSANDILFMAVDTKRRIVWTQLENNQKRPELIGFPMDNLLDIYTKPIQDWGSDIDHATARHIWRQYDNPNIHFGSKSIEKLHCDEWIMDIPESVTQQIGYEKIYKDNYNYNNNDIDPIKYKQLIRVETLSYDPIQDRFIGTAVHWPWPEPQIYKEKYNKNKKNNNNDESPVEGVLKLNNKERNEISNILIEKGFLKNEIIHGLQGGSIKGELKKELNKIIILKNEDIDYIWKTELYNIDNDVDDYIYENNDYDDDNHPIRVIIILDPNTKKFTKLSNLYNLSYRHGPSWQTLDIERRELYIPLAGQHHTDPANPNEDVSSVLATIDADSGLLLGTMPLCLSDVNTCPSAAHWHDFSQPPREENEKSSKTYEKSSKTYEKSSKTYEKSSKTYEKSSKTMHIEVTGDGGIIDTMKGWINNFI
eukprot:GHVL01016056.1.p1 GENE.GHVL01016056.1~~GHVL01016056.1.p1  ORF type:complete len:778 (-),score=271.78 GHVL01016056.1:1962-4295(-)